MSEIKEDELWSAFDKVCKEAGVKIIPDQKEGEITVPDIMKAKNISRDRAEKIIADLIENGKLVCVGYRLTSGKRGHAIAYKITDEKPPK